MIKYILSKYENFYVGGSGYTFQVEVDDFNKIVKHIENFERLQRWNDELQEELIEKDEKVEALEKEIVEHCETKGLAGRQVFALTKRVDELVEENKGLRVVIEAERGFVQNNLLNDEELKQKEKKTISKILAYVEKNHDAPEIEEYLWKMLDKGTEFE